MWYNGVMDNFDTIENANKYLRLNGIRVHEGKQGKHLIGHKNYTAGKSVLTEDADKLFELYRYTGNAVSTSKGRWAGKQLFVHETEIGTWYSEDGLQCANTTQGIIHYSKTGIHIVPARPVDYEG